jgi:DNA-binding response OmpR family regulator
MRLLCVRQETETVLSVRAVAGDDAVVDAVNAFEPALKLMDAKPLDAVLTDLARVGGGVDPKFLISTRARCPKVALLVVSRQSELSHKLVAFEAGVDDYVVKPCDPRELIARIKAITRRLRDVGSFGTSARFRTRDVSPARRERFQTRRPSAIRPQILPDSLAIAFGTAEIALSPMEFRIASILLDSTGSPVSTAALCLGLWGREGAAEHNALHVHLSRLRARLGPAKLRLERVRGQGYRIAWSQDAERASVNERR